MAPKLKWRRQKAAFGRLCGCLVLVSAARGGAAVIRTLARDMIARG